MASATLKKLAADIRCEHAAVETCLRDSLAHARAAGEKLLQVKATLKHGEYMSWVKGNCRFKHSTANLYTAIARAWDQLAESQRVENLSLREAARLISNTPDRDPDDRQPGDGFHPPPTDAILAWRQLAKSTNKFLLTGFTEAGSVDYLVKDRTLHRYEIGELVDLLFALRHRVNEALHRLKERMEVDVDEAYLTDMGRDAKALALDEKIEAEAALVGESTSFQ